MAKKEVNYYAYNQWKTNLINNVHPEDNTFERGQWPNNEVISYFISRFEVAAGMSEHAISTLFAHRPVGINDDDYMYIKISMLNDVYSTHLSSSEKDDIVTILRNYIDRFSSENYDETLVQDICNACGEQVGKVPYSFVTKYCSHQNENLYPIYDRYVVTMLRWYRDMRYNNGFNDFSFAESSIKAEPEQYNAFRNVLVDFMRLFPGFTFKQMDMFLWSAGKNYFPIYVDKDIIPQ